MNAMPFWKTESFDVHQFLHAIWVHAGVMRHDETAERMANEVDREIVDDIEQRREVQNIFGERIHRALRLRAVAVASQIERIYVIVAAQTGGDPVPVSGVVQSTVNQDQRWFAVSAEIPELQLQAV
jgi:hypothetical protein